MRVPLAYLPRPLLLALLPLLSPRLSRVSALQGDSWCGFLMCVQATVNANDSTVTYELKPLNQLGWMAIGFGRQMADTPMVILWQAANGTTILSQRQATGLADPLPVTHPPRAARVSHRANTRSGISSMLAFDITKADEPTQSLIWAFGVTPPDARPDASIEQHLDAGTFFLDLSRELRTSDEAASSSTLSSSSRVPAAASSPTVPASPQSQSSSTVAADGLSRTDTLQVAHAVLSAAGFLIVLPLGTLVARWSRVFTPKWSTAHWFIDVVLGIPLVCVGWALGPLAVAQQGREHIVTAHQICGVVLFVLYIVEVALGTFIHLRRPKEAAAHPPRNVVHVVLGLAVFGLSMFQVSILCCAGCSPKPS
ncbi:hypothetical protein C8Q76DRAFT_620351 [Earliella scabrosa]|nr:hypothetical protein C8Q76DRAFT_620351 [Earliella scabrosa]